MKKSLLLAAATAASALALVLTACTGPETTAGDSSSAAGASGKSVWYADVIDSNPTTVAVAQGMNSVFSKNGVKMTRSLAVDPTTGQLDIGAQSQAITRAIQSNPAAIAYFMLDPTASRPQVEQAMTAKIPVFAAFGKPSFDVNAFIALYDNQQGYTSAKYLASQLQKGDKVAIISGPNVINVNDEVAGATKALQEAGMTIVGNVEQQRNLTDDANGGKTVMQGILQQNPDVKGVFVYNDETVLGAIAVAKQAGKNILFTSRNATIDAINAIKAGDLLGTCDIQPVQMGELLATAIVAEITGRKTYTKSEQIPSPSAEKCMVTKDNVSEWKSPEQLVNYVKIPMG
ncbi:sugar ABC transporter substrate-binding protein [Microbacterium sp. ASV49]|uniref:Sugar ABC transporter substrate-binding protein n=1 Tax=Microbacterium candidum TaxID=3041922 RepID=A0ABT7MW58_9MICO|nr:sugar ABC transporter substrate-binding protein [Microbacterium sp. ASV49]MDL9978686.1 sugar ABC transporter substrate-binding protein [Microbacterium sp. ASV49]